MKTVILGGSGFIGRSLAQQLCEAGEEVVTVSRAPLTPVAPNHRHRDVTLDDRRALGELLTDARYVFHAASDTTPGSSRLQPALEVSNNLLPLAGLLECLQAHPEVTLVYISSGGAIYDTDANTVGIAETANTAPPSYYGAGKLAAEALIQAYHRQTGHAAMILRPSNVYGPGQRPKNQFGIIPTLCRCLADGTTFTIWGDGTAVRDFVYLQDFLDLCQRIVRRASPKPGLETLNVGTGTGHSVNALCELLETVSGRTLHVEHQPPRGVDTGQVILDSSRARALLGWQPVTPLAEGLAATWQWFQQQA